LARSARNPKISPSRLPAFLLFLLDRQEAMRHLLHPIGGAGVPAIRDFL
jgi:hypothetical protein